MPEIIDYAKLKNSQFFRKHVQVLYEDDDLLALNKPAQIAVHPGGSVPPGRTMIDLARAYLFDQPHYCDITLVHRLDRETSGVLLFAKHSIALEKMNTIIRKRKVEKYYCALVKGKVKQNSGVIKSRLALVDGDKHNARMVITPEGQGKTAITHFTVEKRFGTVATLLKIKTHTGRMHQIRVHTQAQGYPIWGDSRYGDFKFNKKIAKTPYLLKRQFLHAYSITFPHPIHNRKITITAAMPDDLIHVLEVLEDRFPSTANTSEV